MKPIKEVLKSPLITKITGTGDDGTWMEITGLSIKTYLNELTRGWISETYL